MFSVESLRRFTFTSLGMASIGAMLALSTPARAAVDYFLTISGVKTPQPLEIQSFSWGAPSTGGGALGAARSQKPALHSIILTLKPSALSTAFSRAAVSGKRFPRVTLDVKASTTKKTIEQITLENVMVSKVQMGGGPGHLTETVTLEFTRMQETYQGAGHGAAGPVTLERAGGGK